MSIVGDFTEEEIESCILDYLGTITASGSAEQLQRIDPIFFGPSPSDLQFQQVRTSYPNPSEYMASIVANILVYLLKTYICICILAL